jgi:hypothetical protein
MIMTNKELAQEGVSHAMPFDDGEDSKSRSSERMVK